MLQGNYNGVSPSTARERWGVAFVGRGDVLPGIREWLLLVVVVIVVLLLRWWSS